MYPAANTFTVLEVTRTDVMSLISSATSCSSVQFAPPSVVPQIPPTFEYTFPPAAQPLCVSYASSARIGYGVDNTGALENVCPAFAVW